MQRLDAGEVEVHLLHSKLSSLAQSRVFEPPSEGARKVILATDIAETSVTINDVVYVVDSGLHNQRGYDSSTLLASLDPDWIPKSSARQRQGRAVSGAEAGRAVAPVEWRTQRFLGLGTVSGPRPTGHVLSPVHEVAV